MIKNINISLKEYEITEPWILNSKDIFEVEKINNYLELKFLK